MQNEYKIDNRTKEDVKRQINTLSKSYVPEWNFDQQNPDIGSVIALIFSDQLKGNIERFNDMLGRFHTELVNFMDISLLPAHPAKATVLMDIIQDTISGVQVPKGTKLIANLEDRRVIFETAYSVYMSGARIDSILMTSGENGKVIPVFGDFRESDYIEGYVQNKSENDSETEEAGIPKFKLFDFSKKGIEKQAVLLYHDSIFDTENELIDCRIKGNEKFLKEIELGHYRLLYYSEEEFIEIKNYNIVNDHIYFSKDFPGTKINISGKEYGLMVIESKEPKNETIIVDSIEFSSSGSPREIEYAGNGTTDYDVEKFNVFGDTLALYSECYIGMDSYFSKKGSKITISFNTNYIEKYAGIVKEPEELDLRIVKRKKKYVPEETIVYAYAQEITIEYYNGIGWKRLNCQQEYASMFAKCEGGRIELTFICPDDWEPVLAGGYNGRVLKMQLLKSDNCYYQPCIHCYPRIQDMSIAYTYEDRYEKPAIGKRLYGTAVQDITSQIQENRPMTMFSKGNYNDTAIYIGFNKVFENGPISLWWKLKDSTHDSRKKLRFYYSTNSEFKEMKIVDYTENLSKTGVMLFLPQPDMGMLEIEGKRLCYIKIVEENADEMQLCPEIENISLNAVEVRNIETMDEEEFYIDSVEANMSFPIKAERILDATVWVNERDELTKQDMDNLMKNSPENVRVNYNYLGEIEEFFVKWNEVNTFSTIKDFSRSYVLDRMENRIIFGDGINVRIPRNTSGTAFVLQARCCTGSEGNVPAGTINESSTNLMFVNNIYNPEPAYGGSDMEKKENALERGASLLSSGGRFVTEKDYLSEINCFSDVIEQSSIVMNVDRYGRYRDGMMHIVLLMKDFMESSASFYSVQSELKKHLLEHCELSISPDEMLIEEPLFVELNVDVWVKLINMEDSFEIQNTVADTLKEYLNPISGKGSKGWDIGTIPRKSQIMMKLNSIKSKGIINHIMINARYNDKFGTHEVDLEDLKITPYMVVKSGNHKIHLVQK